MREFPERDRTDPTGSRWWYWLAAVLAVAGVWALSFAWVALAVASTFGGGVLGDDPVGVAFGLSILVAAVPMAVVGLLLPVATYYDARAVRAAGLSWRPPPGRYAAVALLSLATGVGPVVFVTYYLYRRHRAVGVP